MKGCVMPEEEIIRRKKYYETQQIYSRFDFINSHKGYRPGGITTFIGTSGSGKSSIIRETIIDSAKDKEVFVWLSEESEKDYSAMINQSCPHKDIKEKINLFSELDVPEDVFCDLKVFLLYFKEQVLEHNAEIVFVDNITTSYMYSDTVGCKGQSETARFLRNLSEEFNIPIVVVAHTKKGVFDNNGHLISLDDIRGTTAIPMKTSYGYALQAFKVNGEIRPFIRVEKSRYHKGCINRFYALFYDKEFGCYISDSEVDFELFNEAFKCRNRLKD